MLVIDNTNHLIAPLFDSTNHIWMLDSTNHRTNIIWSIRTLSFLHNLNHRNNRVKEIGETHWIFVATFKTANTVHKVFYEVNHCTNII